MTDTRGQNQTQDPGQRLTTKTWTSDLGPQTQNYSLNRKSDLDPECQTPEIDTKTQMPDYIHQTPSQTCTWTPHMNSGHRATPPKETPDSRHTAEHNPRPQTLETKPRSVTKTPQPDSSWSWTPEPSCQLPDARCRS